MSVSNQEAFGRNVLALDTFRRKLLFLPQSGKKLFCLIIDLKDLNSCTVKKEYNSINAGDLDSNNISSFLRSICLHLGFRNGSVPVSLPLFDAHRKGDEEFELLETKARKWEMLVSEFLPGRDYEIA